MQNVPQAIAGTTSTLQQVDPLAIFSSTSSIPSGSSAPDEPTTQKRRKNSIGDDGGRAQLACYYCRTKRIRCSGERPVCQACVKAEVECEWPAGRRRKRTRKEMEEAKKNEDMHGTANNPSAQTTFNASDFFNFPPANDTMWSDSLGPDINTMLFPGPSEPAEMTVSQSITNALPDITLLNALRSQTAYINGDPKEGQDLELYYYRFSGTTAISPGVNRISLKLQRRVQDTPGAPQPEIDHVVSTQLPVADIFDSSGMPHPHVRIPLFDIFYKHMSQHFPSVSYQRMNERFESGTMSNFLANCICALAARFSKDAKDSPTQACAPFIAKAQELIVPLLHLPAYDVATGLTMLAWANFGQNSESGLWQYSGMAFRMAVDLGIHEQSEIFESQAHAVRTRLLFWTMFVTDRIVAFATGRPTTIPEDIIDIPLPVDMDFFPDPSRNAPGNLPEMVEPVPFVQIVKLMIICGRISNVLNGRRGRVRTLVSAAEPLPELLARLQEQLVHFYSGLPESLKWSSGNFKHQEARGHGGTFLSLHLWANAVLALVYHPELLKSPSGMDTPLNRSMSRSIKLSLASSRQICESMVFADLVSDTAYISSPFIVQPLYVAAMAIINEMRSVQGGVGDVPNESITDMFLISVAKQNLSALFKAVERMEIYWAGVTFVANLLEKRSGLVRSTPRHSHKTFISLPDHGLLRRFTTDRDNVGPATETSLRDSIAKGEGLAAGSGQLWLPDFLTGYTVENMSFSPVEGFDLAGLLADGFDVNSAGVFQAPQGSGPAAGALLE